MVVEEKEVFEQVSRAAHFRVHENDSLAKLRVLEVGLKVLEEIVGIQIVGLVGEPNGREFRARSCVMRNYRRNNLEALGFVSALR